MKKIGTLDRGIFLQQSLIIFLNFGLGDELLIFALFSLNLFARKHIFSVLDR